jgi:TonB family protein
MFDIKSARLLVAVLLLAGTHRLLAQEATPLEEKLTVAKPLLIVPPDYPAQALAEGRTAEIRVQGTVTTEGVLESVVFSNRPGEEDFVEAARAVLKMWRFIPGVDSAACSTVPLDASFRIWIEIKEKEPAIFVSVPATADEKSETKKESAQQKKLTWYRRPQPVFPGSAHRAGVEGMAYVLMRIAKSGEITEANVLASSPVREFGDEAARATRRARYEPFDSSAWGKESICSQVEFRFCIGENAEFPLRQCGSRRESSRLRHTP